MGFLDALFHASKRVKHHDDEIRKKLASAWSLPEIEDEVVHDAESTTFDRSQWRKRLKRMITELPETQKEWPDLIADGRALGFTDQWMSQCQREEFALIVRQMVADGEFTHKEHTQIDLIRDAMEIPNDEAEAVLQQVVKEAEDFFGKPIHGA